MSKGLEALYEVRLALRTLMGVLEDIFVANNEPIKETIKKAKHASKQIPKIETALKNYMELTSKPIILYGRHQGQTKSIIDYVCKNYKEIKITNLEDENKLKALEIIKAKKVYPSFLLNTKNLEEYNKEVIQKLTQEEYDLVKEVLKNE